MIGWFEKQAWKIAAAGLLVLVISLGVQLARVAGDRAKIEKQRAALELSIEDPATGYRARLRTCTDNTVTLTEAITAQGEKVKALGEESRAKTAEAQKAIDAAERGRAAADAKVKSLMRPLVATETCQRVNEADARLLETLK